MLTNPNTGGLFEENIMEISNIIHENGGLVLASDIREYGRANLDFINNDHFIFDNVNIGSQVWMSHGDTIKKLPNNSTLLASTSDVENAAFRVNGKDIYGLQFHPEVTHTNKGKKIIENFRSIHFWIFRIWF